MTDDMVERVAKAIYGAELAEEFGPEALDEFLEADDSWKLREKAARAAIEALRKPSNKMLDAGWPEVTTRGPWRRNAARCWQAMIDTALSTKEKGEGT